MSTLDEVGKAIQREREKERVRVYVCVEGYVCGVG